MQEHMPSAFSVTPGADFLPELTAAQQTVFDDRRRFRAVIAGRRWGKTFLGCAELLRGAAERTGNYYYIAPCSAMTSHCGWETLKMIVPRNLIAEAKEEKLELQLKNGSIIYMRHLGDVSEIKETCFRGAVIDEFALFDLDFWKPFILPSIADLSGWALWLATPTPTGLGYCYESMSFELQPIYNYTSLQGGNIRKEYIERARKTLDKVVFQCELEARIV